MVKMISREEAKDLIKSDLDSYGKPKKLMTKIDFIYNSFENKVKELEAVKNRVCECRNKQASIDAKIRWNDNKINYCPYCGGKIEIKSEVKENDKI